MQHLQLKRGTVSLTERLLRQEQQQLAHYLRNAMLASTTDNIDLLISEEQIGLIHQALAHQESAATAGQQALIHNLINRWQTSQRA
ncbi:MAG: hypothetical protein KYX62_07230 [Pseudomonadota bacterium]|nr:hypothetical protein [Pseudomonadota bacterium]